MYTIDKMILTKATAKNKKYKATFIRSDKSKKSVSFGDNRYEDYTMHKDKERKKAYQNRHKKDKINDPQTAGALSYYILWSQPDFMEGLREYVNKFNINVYVRL